jgi:hypothetical protein
MHTIWQWRNHGDTVWKGLSTEKPRQFWIQKEYREIEIGEPRFHYEAEEVGARWPHRFSLINLEPRDSSSSLRLVVKPALRWCEENVDEEAWMQVWANVYFKDYTAAMAFRLRWC